MAAFSYTNLNEKELKKCKKELNENPEQVRAHIESLRRWLQSMPHISGCPSDDKFLLSFLRVAKFDHSKAQRRLDNYCTIRGSPRGIPHWFVPVPLDDPSFEEIFNLKVCIPIGYNSDGEYVIVSKEGAGLDPAKIPLDKMMRISFMIFDVLQQDEHVSAIGLTGLSDMGEVSGKELMAFGNQSNMKSMVSAMQDAYPMRFKNFYYYREPAIFDVIFKMFEFFMDEKLRKRLHRVKNNIGKVYERDPSLKEVFPSEYDGKGPSLDERAAEFKQKVIDYYTHHADYLKNIKVDESKRPEATLKFLRQYPDYKGETLESLNYEKKGTYTKFNV